MVRLSSCILRTPEEWEEAHKLHQEMQANIDANHSGHVVAAWSAIVAAGIKIPYMCSYAVAYGTATVFLINSLEVVRQHLNQGNQDGNYPQ